MYLVIDSENYRKHARTRSFTYQPTAHDTRPPPAHSALDAQGSATLLQVPHAGSMGPVRGLNAHGSRSLPPQLCAHKMRAGMGLEACDGVQLSSISVEEWACEGWRQWAKPK